MNTWFDTLEFLRANQEQAYAIMVKRAGVTVDEYKEYDAETKIFTLQENLKAFSPGSDMTSFCS